MNDPALGILINKVRECCDVIELIAKALQTLGVKSGTHLQNQVNDMRDMCIVSAELRGRDIRDGRVKF